MSPEIELLSPMGAEHPYVAEFGWIAGQGETQAMPNAESMWRLVQDGTLTPATPVELTYDNGQGLIFTRRVSVDDRYMFTVADTVTNNSAAPVTLSPYGLVMRRNVPRTTYYWVVHEGFIGVFNGTLDDPTYANLGDNNGMRQFQSTGGWLGITDKYWMAAVVPPQSEAFNATYKAFDANGTKAYQSDFMMTPKTVAPNGSETVVHHFFAGAKVVDIVDGYARTLGINRFDMAVDWGWFNPLTKWMFLALDYIYRFVGNYGITILIFTVIVKLLFFPLANTSYRAMSKMKKLQPEMERLRERYKDDKVKQQQELMTLYQKEKVNPLAGCMPMLIQIPVFFSLYKVLLVTIDMRHAPFFGWIRDLSAPEPTSLFNLFGLLPFAPPTFLMIGALLDPDGLYDVAADEPQSAAGRSGAGEDVQLHADPVRLHAGELPGRPRDLLDVEQHPLDRAADLHHEIDRHADRFSRSAARYGCTIEAGRTGGETRRPARLNMRAHARYLPSSGDRTRTAALREILRFCARGFRARPHPKKPDGRNRVCGPLQRGQIEPRECADRTQDSCARVEHAGPHARDQFLPLGRPPDARRPSRLRLCARVEGADPSAGADLIFEYLRGRPQLRRVILLVDSRRGLLENDVEVMTLLDRAAVSYQTHPDQDGQAEAGRARRDRCACGRRIAQARCRSPGPDRDIGADR